VFEALDHAVLRTDRAAMADGTLAADEVITVGFATGGAGLAVINCPVLEGAGGRQVAMADADVIWFSWPAFSVSCGVVRWAARPSLPRQKNRACPARANIL
jgi:hypothetical protein